jgi:hypothetical protein
MYGFMPFVPEMVTGRVCGAVYAPDGTADVGGVNAVPFA